MTDLTGTIKLDEGLPPNAVNVVVEQGEIHVTVSPTVEREALSVLRSDVYEVLVGALLDDPLDPEDPEDRKFAADPACVRRFGSTGTPESQGH